MFVNYLLIYTNINWQTTNPNSVYRENNRIIEKSKCIYRIVRTIQRNIVSKKQKKKTKKKKAEFQASAD